MLPRIHRLRLRLRRSRGAGSTLLKNRAVAKVRDLIARPLAPRNCTTLAGRPMARRSTLAFARPRRNGRSRRWPWRPACYRPTGCRRNTTTIAASNCFHIGPGRRRREPSPANRRRRDDFDPCPLPTPRSVSLVAPRRFCRCDNDFRAGADLYAAPDGTDAAGWKCSRCTRRTNGTRPVLADGDRVLPLGLRRPPAPLSRLVGDNRTGRIPACLFGNYTQQVSACFQPRAIPGSRKIAFNRRGASRGDRRLAGVVDRAARLDPQVGRGRIRSIES